MDTPPADLDLTVELVDRLVRSQHPAFAGPLRLVTHGWDNDIYRLGSAHAVRLPRREVAAMLMRNEQRWLPGIAERMPVAVPTPVAVGHPNANYPWPWSIVEWFDGVPADELDVGARDAIAVDLAAAVDALHVPAPAQAPRNPYRGVPLAERDELVRRRLGESALDGASIRGLETAWDAGLAAHPWTARPVWLHGDLHPANVVVGDDGRLQAIIDFGDLCAGDPASDLAAAWMCFGPGGRQVFRDRLRYDQSTWVRARAWAASLALALHSGSDGSERMTAVADHTIEQVLNGD